jgi:hypothetical protein
MTDTFVMANTPRVSAPRDAWPSDGRPGTANRKTRTASTYHRGERAPRTGMAVRQQFVMGFSLIFFILRLFQRHAELTVLDLAATLSQ